jgi:hypothetical protein
MSNFNLFTACCVAQVRVLQKRVLSGLHGHEHGEPCDQEQGHPLPQPTQQLLSQVVSSKIAQQ